MKKIMRLLKVEHSDEDDIGWKSALLRSLGTVIIGSPKSYDLPKDFYDLQVDRVMPKPSQFNQNALKQNITVNDIRRKVLCKTSGIAKWVLIGVFVVFYGYQMLSVQAEKTLKVGDYSEKSLRECRGIQNLYNQEGAVHLSQEEIDKCGLGRRK